MKKHILVIDSVQKNFGNKTVLSDVYLKCETNDIIGILGRNGFGKSTLLKIIFGITFADFKHIKIDGIVKTKNQELLNEISYLHQENFIPKHLSVKKAILLTLEKENLIAFYEDKMIKSIIEKNINQLSSGELRYLEIKLVLLNPAKFALLDEPYNGLSPIMVDEINKLILENTARKGIIITDHNYENIIKISTKLILMKEGKAHHIKDKNELIEKGYLNQEIL